MYDSLPSETPLYESVSYEIVSSHTEGRPWSARPWNAVSTLSLECKVTGLLTRWALGKPEGIAPGR